jgi:hypothetical protein
MIHLVFWLPSLKCIMASFQYEGKVELTIFIDGLGVVYVIDKCLVSNLELCMFQKMMHMMITTTM